MSVLKDKIIIVTGGEGLLGKAMIEDIKIKGGIAINADISVNSDLNANRIKMDITLEESIVEGLKAIHQKFGKIDGLVNNAYPRTKDWGNKFEEIKVDSWKTNVDLQMNSVFVLTQKIIPYLKKSKGSIVNIASIYGIVGGDFTVYENTEMTLPAAYSAIKGGVINFSRYAASYFGKSQVRINVVSPGGIYDHQPEIFVKQYEHKVPMKRMGTPKDIAPAVSFLLSDEAKYITGQNIAVDGGWTAI